MGKNDKIITFHAMRETGMFCLIIWHLFCGEFEFDFFTGIRRSCFPFPSERSAGTWYCQSFESSNLVGETRRFEMQKNQREFYCRCLEVKVHGGRHAFLAAVAWRSKTFLNCFWETKMYFTKKKTMSLTRDPVDNAALPCRSSFPQYGHENNEN